MTTAIAQALVGTFVHTHSYKKNKYQKLGYVMIKTESGNWVSGVLYRPAIGFDLCVREQADFFAKFETQLSDSEKAQARAALGPDPES